MSIERYDPYEDPDAVPCPEGCGRLTDDPYGGPCTVCWRKVVDLSPRRCGEDE